MEHLNVERMHALMPALGPEITTARDQRAVVVAASPALAMGGYLQGRGRVQMIKVRRAL